MAVAAANTWDQRVMTLDTVRAKTGMGIFGDVGSAHTLRPLPDAEIQVAGASPVRTDSAGRFFVPLKHAGTYVVRARKPGYAPQTLAAFHRRTRDFVYRVDTAAALHE